MTVQDFITLWSTSGASERANKDSYLKDLADVLGAPHPAPRTGDRERDTYVFEADAVLAHEGGAVSIGKMDLYKAECFVLEAKQGSHAGAATVGTARRNTPSWSIAMQDAYGQALNYARTLAKPPPFLVIADIGYCFDLYASFDDSGHYRPYKDGQSARIFLADLPRHVGTLKAIWTDPHSLDPARRKAQVTREIAGHIAELASALEDAGHKPEVVAKFLMRALFTMFAEDVGLLRADLFTQALEHRWCKDPSSFPKEVEALWSAMNTGGELFMAGRILQFNGGLFADPAALPLDSGQLRTLLAAAKCDWSNVEPAIFGTLLERALDDRERHALGAHYTPRAYVERLVRPTIEEPLRREWDDVRVEARLLASAGKVEDARTALGNFHRQLCTLRVLDPACGTGNFLYVALDTFKRVESEVLALLTELGDTQTALGLRVSPSQFLGIEVKPWAREIAELVLWIGHLSWNARIYGKAAAREPVLESYGNIECRDAILAWDSIEPVLDDAGVPVTRWDGVTTKVHPVTGKDVPDETKTVALTRYVNARPAVWPSADFVVGNPPFIGGWKIRQARGDGYVDALRQAYPDVPEKADYVMFWWECAARLIRARGLIRFGLITTNSITQTFQKRVVVPHLDAAATPLRFVYAVADHPWVEASDGAAVRIAMTVAELAGGSEARPILGTLVSEPGGGDITVQERPVDCINADLRAGVDLRRAVSLRANEDIASPGVQLFGSGFVIDKATAERLRGQPGSQDMVRAYVNGRDLSGQNRGEFVIDFFGLEQDSARAAHPGAYQHVVDRVLPERCQNRVPFLRDRWWRFGRDRPGLRAALFGLPRYIATGETAKHRFFVFLESSVLPDNMLTGFGLEDALFIGVLSSRAHVTWALASGGTLEDRPRYTKSVCFDPFPFPDPDDVTRARIRALGERLDAHRKARQAAHPELTITGMYNVLEKLRSGEALTDKERIIHDHGLVSILREIHDDLDTAVLDAYGWAHDIDDASLLVNLVALNAERAAEERRGLVRYLRPEFQKPEVAVTQTLSLGFPVAAVEEVDVALAKWPATLSDRITAVREALGTTDEAVGVEQVARRFKGARRADVAAILESLSALGIAVSLDAGNGRRWMRMRAAA